MSGENSLRAFIAVEIGPEVRRQLAALQARLKASGADVRWVRPEGIHLTLRFLGDIRPADIGRLAGVMAEAVAEQAPVELTAAGWGVFPDPQRPRVIWVGLPGADEKLSKAAAALEEKLIAAGFGPADKPWKPHLTLGRVQSPRGREPLLRALAGEGEKEYGRFLADRLILFQSRLERGGAVYTVLQEVPFAPAGERAGVRNKGEGNG